MEILLVPVAAPLFKSRSIAEHTFSISVFAFFVSGNTENIKSAVKTKFANTSARMTTNLAEGKDGKTHYAVLNVSLVLNKKSDNYKKYTQDFLTNQDDTIKNDIIKVVSGYTFEQFNQNSDAIKDTILEDMQNLFGKDYVIGVNFSKLTAQ